MAPWISILPGRLHLRPRVDELVPRLRRVLDEVLAVPQQLRVGVGRRRVEPALVGRGLQDGPEAFPCSILAAMRGGHTARSTPRWRTRRSRRRPCHQVDRGVLGARGGGRAAGAAVSASLAERVELDLVLAAGALVAALGGLLNGAARLVVDPPVERDRARRSTTTPPQPTTTQAVSDEKRWLAAIRTTQAARLPGRPHMPKRLRIRRATHPERAAEPAVPAAGASAFVASTTLAGRRRRRGVAGQVERDDVLAPRRRRARPAAASRNRRPGRRASRRSAMRSR